MPLWSYLERGGRRAISIAHRRWGKDDVAMHHACVAAHKRPATYWHMLPQASQADKAVWSAVNPHTGKRRIDEAFPKEIRARTLENDMMIQLRNGATWQVVGSDNFNSLVGAPPAGVVFSEFAIANPYSWAYLKPILDENDGWAVFITTPRGRNHAYKMLKMAQETPGWFGEVSSVAKTGRFSAAQLHEQKMEYIKLFGEDAGAAMFEQEMMCSFDAAILGAYYGREFTKIDAEGRIKKVPHDPSLPVYTAWDLGRTDDTAIWFYQVSWGEIRIIDHYSNNGQAPKHYAERLYGREIDVAEWGEYGKPKSWGFGKPIEGAEHRIAYRYADCWLPHDGKPKTFASPRSAMEQLHDFKLKVRIVPSLSIQDGITAARATLPKCVFDEQRTFAGSESLRNYRREWDPHKQVFRDTPLHDKTSHDADAFRMLSLVWKMPPEEAPEERPRFPEDQTADEVFWPKSQSSEIVYGSYA
ncbi:hypothetical protein [Robbsia andropogonis]|nr:hypothetical protein [Robbsia andropogonis]